MASLEMYRWFSEVMNLDHGFRGYLEEARRIWHFSANGNDIASQSVIPFWRQTRSVLTFPRYHHTEGPTRCRISPNKHKVHQFRALCKSWLADRSCHDHGRKVPYGRSYLRTCIPKTTCLKSNRILGNRRAALDLWSTLKRLWRCIRCKDGRTPRDPNRLDGAEVSERKWEGIILG